jgi:hypothetical protein
MPGYQKICYWLNQKELEEIRGTLEKTGMLLVEEIRIPCRVLRISSEIGLVPPSAWEGFCKRRTSWYGSSGKAGKFLVVSKRPLDIPGPGDKILISESNFRPDYFPSLGEIEELSKSVSFQKRMPQRWDNLDPAEKDFYRRWFERYQVKEPFDFEEIFMYHSANHANFLEPRFFVTMNDLKVSYSIADSLHTCSSCLEFFNILGEQWPLKYVVPCLGAVQFARLPRDRYFKVVSLNRHSHPSPQSLFP